MQSFTEELTPNGVGLADNYVAGSGGGLCISDCPNTLIRNTIFNGNTAFLVSYSTFQQLRYGQPAWMSCSWQILTGSIVAAVDSDSRRFEQVGGGVAIRGAGSINTQIQSSYFLSNTASNFFGGPHAFNARADGPGSCCNSCNCLTISL